MDELPIVKRLRDYKTECSYHVLTNPDGPEAATLIAELAGALRDAIQWDSHDEHGIPAVWLDDATKALAKATQ